MVLVLLRCLRIISVRIALYIIPSLLWLVLIHVELGNCPVPGTKTFGPLPLCSVVNPIKYSMVKIPHYNTVSFTHFANSIMYCFIVMLGYVGTTIYYSNGNCLCAVTSLHHMASLQSASACNCTSYAGIVSLMYNNTPLPFFPFCPS